MREFDFERQCRLNGKSPTMRDRWKAFHRLYRICTRDAKGHKYQDAIDSLTIIDGFWPWVSLMEGNGDILKHKPPAFLRKMLLKSSMLRLAREKAVEFGIRLPTDDNAVLEFIRPK